MPKIKVHLSIGISDASKEDVLEIGDDEWNAYKTEEERQELINDYWQDWANNYIDGYSELVE